MSINSMPSQIDVLIVIFEWGTCSSLQMGNEAEQSNSLDNPGYIAQSMISV